MSPWFDVPALEGSVVRLEPLSVGHTNDLALAAEEDRSSYAFTLVPRDRLQDVIALVPAITAPTVSPLYGTEWFAVESVIAEATVRELIPKLLRAGAVGIIEYPLNKIVG